MMGSSGTPPSPSKERLPPPFPNINRGSVNQVAERESPPLPPNQPRVSRFRRNQSRGVRENLPTAGVSARRELKVKSWPINLSQSQVPLDKNSLNQYTNIRKFFLSSAKKLSQSYSTVTFHQVAHSSSSKELQQPSLPVRESIGELLFRARYPRDLGHFLQLSKHGQLSVKSTAGNAGGVTEQKSENT